MDGVKIYVITHKPVKSVTPSPTYRRLFVGAALPDRKVPAGYLRDDQGDGGISAKNASYCELTGLYWIWKHSKADIAGLVHYRRYLFAKRCPRNGHEDILAMRMVLEADEIRKTLAHSDIILPELYSLNEYNVRSHYETFHHIEDLMCTREVIAEHCPEYLEAFDDVMRYRKFFFANMFVMKKELVDSYCEWLFDILFEVERRTDTSDYDDYQKRIYGFLSERLLNVWVRHNGLKPAQRQVYDPEEFQTLGDELKQRLTLKKIRR
ncbi:MAG: DUF4422 domain-containing protein [Lachnospiraceae bacterium]|nr:DUF4422 domain-containing protein [Lachnospiraceae bacterium]MBR0402732.1 DUF4422 domain-containing protein [Lachnospiraceae bacterium]